MRDIDHIPDFQPPEPPHRENDLGRKIALITGVLPIRLLIGLFTLDMRGEWRAFVHEWHHGYNAD